MDTVPSQSQLQDVGCSSGVPHSIASSDTKRKKRPAAATRQLSAKRFKPPMAGNMLRSPVVTRSHVMTPVTGDPVMRLVVPPEVMGPRSPAHSPRNSPTSLAASPSASLATAPSASLAVKRSPSPSTSEQPFLDEETTLPGHRKPRRLKSEIWKDMDPIYHNGRLVQAQCKHCNEIFSAARNSGNSHMRRHLSVCEPLPMAGSTVVKPVTGAPVMRLVVSPVVMGPRSPAHSPRNSLTSLAASPSVSLAAAPSVSLAVERSPPPSTSEPPFLDEETTLPDSTSGQSKPRRLRSEIWKDMDPIYHNGRLVQAQCKHCNEVFSAARNSGTSHMCRHLRVCEPLPMVGNMLRSPVVTRVTGAPVSLVVMGPRSLAHSPRNSPTSLAAAPSASLAAERSPSPSTSEPPLLDEETTLPDSTSGQCKPRRLRSEIWKDMDPIYHNGRLVQAQCKHCNEVFSAARNSGTSQMRRHLRVCEPRHKMHDMVKKLQSSTETSVLTNWQFDRTITRCELIRLIVLHELPFSFVEYEGFRSYSLSLNPLAESVSRTSIEENCMEAFRNQQLSIRDVFKDCNCRFSLTADLWTSNQTTCYMVVTCHYIDKDWKVQKRIIKFCVVKTPHDGFNLYDVMLNTIRYYNIEDKLFSITLDNTNANNTMMDLLRVNLSKKSMLHCNGDLFHVRCAAHVLNLIVKDGLELIDGVIHDIRESVKYITSSTSRKDKFEEIIREVGIDCSWPSLDVPTRWDSTCDMLESAFPFEDAFRELGKQDPNYLNSPTLEEWKKADAVCKLLKVFQKATAVVSGTRYPTSNLYFHQIWSVRDELKSKSSSRNPIIALMVLDMKVKFDEYWNISYLSNCIPVILDPRFKFGFVEFRLKRAFGDTANAHIARVDEALRRLFNGYSSEMVDDNATETSVDDNATETSVEGCSWSDWSNHISTQSKQVTGEVELDRYLRDDLYPCNDDSFDILYWWKMHTSKYPIVARMARDVLAVPASTESAFSTSGRIITDHRTRWSDDTVEALICFRDWLREAGASYLDIIKISSLDSGIEELGGA